MQLFPICFVEVMLMAFAIMRMVNVTTCFQAMSADIFGVTGEVEV
jgi:hypothetical protein